MSHSAARPEVVVQMYPVPRALKLSIIIPFTLCVIASLAGCHSSAPTVAVAAPTPKPAQHVPAPLDLSAYKPNEMGVVPVLEYHTLTVPGERVTGYAYPLESFRDDMERLYSLGYRPISLSDFARGIIDCPAGTSPVVITFDDASRGQVEFDDTGHLSPNCAAAVLLEMHDEHSDWPVKATFFVLPMRGTQEYFYDKRYSRQKLNWLVQQGFELGNHTLNHQPGMNHFSDDRVQMEFAEGAALIDKMVPGYNVDTLALPYGIYPKNHHLVRSGSWHGLTYYNICAMRASYRPSYSPADRRFQPYDIYRILPGTGNCKLTDWLNIIERNTKEFPKYISDGDPQVVTIPNSMKKDVMAKRLAGEGLMLRTYDEADVAAARHDPS